MVLVWEKIASLTTLKNLNKLNHLLILNGWVRKIKIIIKIIN